ncbi:MAG: hypothetical protein NTX53_05095 [candidate division WOR-3 bacterium]|nr:hypothetical protein [candidate division WOR-3 bacterium]
MKRVIPIVLALAGLVLAQDVVPIVVKGTGPDRPQAIEDAKRNAVEQALGVAVQGITEMQNFSVIKDIVQSRADGYVSNYTVIEETPFPDRFEVKISANVSKSPLQADTKSLQSALGGFRIMVWYDFRSVTSPKAVENYDYAYDRANEFLSRNRLRYVERTVFDRLKEEARKLFPDTTQPLTVAQQMAVDANVPVFWELSRVVVPERDMGVGGIVTAEATVDIKAYDTYTAEGMGTAVAKGTPAAEYNGGDASRGAMDKAMEQAGDKLLYQMTQKLGDWLLNGKPYLLRFYGISSYKVLRKLKDALKEDPRFGGEMEVVSTKDYSQFDLTFKGAADDLADVMLDLVEKIPELAAIDVAGFFKNQVNFALPGVAVPQAERGLQAPGQK